MMKTTIRYFFSAGLFVLIAFAISLMLGVRYPQDRTAEEIESKYLIRSSSFITIDGVKIHFTDEGNGPVLILLHANYANLIDWNPWPNGSIGTPSFVKSITNCEAFHLS